MNKTISYLQLFRKSFNNDLVKFFGTGKSFTVEELKQHLNNKYVREKYFERTYAKYHLYLAMTNLKAARLPEDHYTNFQDWHNRIPRHLNSMLKDIDSDIVLSQDIKGDDGNRIYRSYRIRTIC